MLPSPYILGIALAALFWTAPGASFDPGSALAQLPADIASECRTPAAAKPACDRAEYPVQWIGRSAHEEWLLVARKPCPADGCRAWLVGRHDGGKVRTLLAVSGALRLELHRDGLPTVHTRLVLGDYASYNRYDWNGEQYVRSETRLVHRVDDFECADETACVVAARDALRRDDTDRAVRIWRQVHGVDWI